MIQWEYSGFKDEGDEIWILAMSASYGAVPGFKFEESWQSDPDTPIQE